MDCLQTHAGFESDTKLLCLRSWIRLLDEFTGVLAFAPMNTIREENRANIMDRVQLGISGKKDGAVGLLQLVCDANKTSGGLEPVRWPLRLFKQRLLKLIHRDIGYALQVF